MLGALLMLDKSSLGREVGIAYGASVFAGTFGTGPRSFGLDMNLFAVAVIYYIGYQGFY